MTEQEIELQIREMVSNWVKQNYSEATPVEEVREDVPF